MSDTPFLGEIMFVGFTFAPRGWELCEGQLLLIADNTALFSLLGTTYGGDGQTTFGLPDLRGRVPVHVGTGPGLSTRRWGQRAGAATVTLSAAQLPAHDHGGQPATSDAATLTDPSAGIPAETGSVDAYASTSLITLPASVTTTGGSQAHNNLQPYQVLRAIIATEPSDQYPSRS